MMRALIIAALLPFSAEAANIIVTVNNVKSGTGDIRASLCENEAAYKADTCFTDAVVKAQKGATQLRFENVPPGTYAIQLMHDKNGNGDMDYNFLGIPKEGYGFSNNIKPRFSMPPFAKTAFPLGTADVSLSISLIQ